MASKAAADLVVRAYHETFGMPVNITRCSNNYGPYQFPNREWMDRVASEGYVKILRKDVWMEVKTKVAILTSYKEFSKNPHETRSLESD